MERDGGMKKKKVNEKKNFVRGWGILIILQTIVEFLQGT